MAMTPLLCYGFACSCRTREFHNEGGEKMYRRLYDHPKAGLLWSVLRTSHLAWLEERYPEDFFQESALFLLSIPKGQELSYRDFAKRAQAHFYRFAKSWGFRRPKGGGAYHNREVVMADLANADGSPTAVKMLLGTK